MNDYANVIFALSNAEFDYGKREGVQKQTKSDYVNVNGPLLCYFSISYCVIFIILQINITYV